VQQMKIGEGIGIGKGKDVGYPGWIQALRFAFWVLYNPLAWTYDWVSRIVSLGKWHDWQRTALPELRGERILDLAFGTGNTLLDLAAGVYHPIGLDLSPAMARIAKRKLKRAGLSAPLVRGRAQQLPFADASIDSVLCTFPAEFILAPGTLSEVARVLRPGGRLVVTAMCKLNGPDPWSRFLDWLYRITGQRLPLPDLDPLLSPLRFEYRTVWRAVGNTAVLLVIADARSGN
jgi:ubiquinone/menaquinone biosynthesis C-methylase UbiE